MERRAGQALLGVVVGVSVVIALDRVVVSYIESQWAWNSTKSLPRGLYERGVWEGGVGSYVLVQAPKKAYELGCVGSRVQVLGKIVGALAGEKVCRKGKALSSPHFEIVTSLEADLVLEDGRCMEVPEGHVWLYTEHARSCDSRFFGPVARSSVLGSITPVWTWEEE